MSEPVRRDYTKSGRRRSAAEARRARSEAKSDTEVVASLPVARDAPRADYTRRGKRKRRRAFLIFSRDDFRCLYCGKSSIEDGVPLEADHIVPRSKGGEDTAGNFITACRECNRSKFDTELEPAETARLQALVSARNAARRISDDLFIELGRV
jgi:5-methylcytosine-specific restriction endonuclease McrA